MQLAIWAVITIVMNALDDAITWVGMRKLPEGLRFKEANPFQASLMKRSMLLSRITKHGVMLFIVIWALAHEDLSALRMLGIALAIVVLNNTIGVVARQITKRKVYSPFGILIEGLHIPKKLAWIKYPLMVLILLLITMLIVWAIK